MTPTAPSIIYWALVLIILPVLGATPFYLMSMKRSKTVLAMALANPDAVEQAWVEEQGANCHVRIKLKDDHTAHVVAYNDHWEKVVADLRAAGVLIVPHDEP